MRQAAVGGDDLSEAVPVFDGCLAGVEAAAMESAEVEAGFFEGGDSVVKTFLSKADIDFFATFRGCATVEVDAESCVEAVGAVGVDFVYEFLQIGLIVFELRVILRLAESEIYLDRTLIRLCGGFSTGGTQQKQCSCGQHPKQPSAM